MNSLLHPSFPLRFLSHTSPSHCPLPSRERSFVSFCFATQLPLLTNSGRNPVPEFQDLNFQYAGFREVEVNEEKKEEERDEESISGIPVPDEEQEEESITGIPVPRQRYIPISKGSLLDGLLSMFESQEEADQFRLVASCLESVIHAEHKGMLEEMRSDYSLSYAPDLKETKEVDRNHFRSKDTEEVTSNNQKMDLHDSVAVRSFQINDEKQHVHNTSPNFSLDLSFLLRSPRGDPPNVSSSKSRLETFY